MSRRVARTSVREGYDRWSGTYDATPNPVVALDRRHSPAALDARRGERVLDAGCGTGVHVGRLCALGCRPVGIDFSRGMLRIARRAAPRAAFVQADLDARLPLRAARFDALLSSLVSEHLTDLRRFFGQAFALLRRGGRLVFSAFHPELALAGIEANFERDGVEYRLGAERHTVDDYLNHIDEAGFTRIVWREHRADAELVDAVPGASKYLGRPVLLLVTAQRGARVRGASG